MIFYGFIGIAIAILIVLFVPSVIRRGDKIVSLDKALGIGVAYSIAFIIGLFSILIVCLE